jgi:hemerythrin-like metal-binding protein
MSAFQTTDRKYLMANLVWHDFLKIGVDFIDNDHKKLLGIMQEVKQTIEQDDFEECVTLLRVLLKESAAHFAREEEFLRQVKYPGLESHIEYHQGLLNKANTIQKICSGIETHHDLKECFDGMANFLIDDILRGDINFKSYLDYHGYIEKT